MHQECVSSLGWVSSWRISDTSPQPIHSSKCFSPRFIYALLHSSPAGMAKIESTFFVFIIANLGENLLNCRVIDPVEPSKIF